METTLCKKCILPTNYSGISLDKNGVCNYCNNTLPINYLGEEKLKTDVRELLKNAKGNSEYDCVVGFSGGRDSTYLLWYIVKILNLKPLAVFANSKLIPEQTFTNIKKTTDILGVDLIIKEHNYLLNSSKHFFKSWSKYPSPATLITMCTGCRLGVMKFVYEEADNRNIPIIFDGGTPFEEGYFKKNLISQNGFRKFSFIFGFFNQVLKNPSLVFNIRPLITLIREYYHIPKYSNKKHGNEKPFIIKPFENYFRWEKDDIEKIIKTELEWERYPGLTSSYRGDCEIGIIRQYFYNKMLGYNDKDDHLSCLIRDNQITRKEALKQVQSDKSVKKEILVDCFEKLGFNYYKYISKVEKNARKHNIIYNN